MPITHSGHHHHQAQCEPTLRMMESIAATIPDAIQIAKHTAWNEGYDAAVKELGLRDYGLAPNPYRIREGRHAA